MPTKELKLADLVNDAGICWDYGYDKATGTLELTVDLDTVANNPTDATITWVQNEDGEGIATVSIEEEEEVSKRKNKDTLRKIPLFTLIPHNTSGLVLI